MVDVKFEEVEQTSSGRDAGEDREERVDIAWQAECDAALVVIVKSVEEKVVVQCGDTAKDFVCKRRPVEADVGFVEHRSALKGQMALAG